MNIHPSHKTRYSDSSLYDYKCVLCGHTDAAGDYKNLEAPCTARDPDGILRHENPDVVRAGRAS